MRMIKTGVTLALLLGVSLANAAGLGKLTVNSSLGQILNAEIDLVSVQSEAGYGKSYLALAAALFLVLERKSHAKIYVIKPMIEIGQKLGYLPGKLEEKMEPYTRYMADLLAKLHRLRPANKLVEEFYYLYLKVIMGIIPRMFRSGPASLKCRDYFIDAIRMFYSTEELSALLSELGFSHISGHSVLGGTVGIHKACKPQPAAG